MTDKRTPVTECDCDGTGRLGALAHMPHRHGDQHRKAMCGCSRGNCYLDAHRIRDGRPLR